MAAGSIGEVYEDRDDPDESGQAKEKGLTDVQSGDTGLDQTSRTRNKERFAPSAGKKSVKKEKKHSGKNIKIKGIRYKGKKYPVTRIAKRAFAGNRYVRKIILGKNIRSIGKEAFAACANLKMIELKVG